MAECSKAIARTVYGADWEEACDDAYAVYVDVMLNLVSVRREGKIRWMAEVCGRNRGALPAAVYAVERMVPDA